MQRAGKRPADDGFTRVTKKGRREKQRRPGFDVDVTRLTSKIGVADLRELVLWIVADGVAPKWLGIRNRDAIGCVVAVLVPGLTPTMVGVALDEPRPVAAAALTSPPELPFLAATFPHAWPTRAPGEKTRLYSPYVAFMRSPIAKAERPRKRAAAAIAVDELVLDPAALAASDYPAHSATAAGRPLATTTTGWAETAPGGSGRIYGLDCEMVLTTVGSELARATLVDADKNVVLDELVRPPHAVTDYLTPYSGITAALLEPVSTTLADVQARLLALVGADDVLVGHSLDNDLRALQLAHPRVVDTAIVFHHPRGPPARPSLKWLASKHLSREIQAAASGHDSAEDARTCVDLLALKLARGADFGLCEVATEPLAARIARAHAARPDKPAGRSGTAAVVDYGTAAGTEAATTVACADDDAVVDGVVAAAPKHDFVWARLRELEFAEGWAAPDAADVPADRPAVLGRLNGRLQRLYDGLPSGTALILLSGSGDPTAMSRLLALRNTFQREFKTKKWDDVSVQWTDVENQQLLEATHVARAGISFLTVKD
ncbi:uncharacterized protein V1510DRAFT_418460 [Dipodascopsis tothii]|uniref:uncharacterized protein n=1 Tax=Dipodascopsis tothii TaxID=44089 RepID=UPI0034CDCEB2